MKPVQEGSSECSVVQRGRGYSSGWSKGGLTHAEEGQGRDAQQVSGTGTPRVRLLLCGRVRVAPTRVDGGLFYSPWANAWQVLLPQPASERCRY